MCIKHLELHPETECFIQTKFVIILNKSNFAVSSDVYFSILRVTVCCSFGLEVQLVRINPNISHILCFKYDSIYICYRICATAFPQKNELSNYTPRGFMRVFLVQAEGRTAQFVSSCSICTLNEREPMRRNPYQIHGLYLVLFPVIFVCFSVEISRINHYLEVVLNAQLQDGSTIQNPL